MARYKRHFKKGGKLKYQTGGSPDPTPYDFGSMSYGDIRSGYKSGDIPLSAIKEQYPLFASDVQGDRMNNAYKIADFFGSIPARNIPNEENPTNYDMQGRNSEVSRRDNQSGELPGYLYETPNYINDINQMLTPNMNFGLRPGETTSPNNTTNQPVTGNSSQNVPISTPPISGPATQSQTRQSPINIDSTSLPEAGGPTAETRALETAGGGSTVANVASEVIGSLGGEDGVSGEDSGGGLGSALQYIPDAINFATGVFGQDDTPAPTQMSDRSVDLASRYPTDINVNPQMQQARANYRAILDDPAASTGQKLAAQAQLGQQMDQIRGEEINRETQLQANKVQLESSAAGRVDATNAQFAEQARQDTMASEANLGLSGNFARQALSSAGQKFLQNRAMKNQESQANRELMAVISAYPESVQRRILEQIDLNG